MSIDGRRLRAACIALLLSITACTVGPNYERPKVDIPADYRDATVGAEQAPLVDTEWWELFNDPQLHRLVRTALDQNKDLQLAVARVDAARAQLGIVGAGRYPQQVGAGASATGTLGSETGARPVPEFRFGRPSGTGSCYTAPGQPESIKRRVSLLSLVL